MYPEHMKHEVPDLIIQPISEGLGGQVSCNASYTFVDDYYYCQHPQERLYKLIFLLDSIEQKNVQDIEEYRYTWDLYLMCRSISNQYSKSDR